MKVIRLLIYEGTPNAVQQVLARSQADGVKKYSNKFKLTALTLGELPVDFYLQIQEEEAKITQYKKEPKARKTIRLSSEGISYLENIQSEIATYSTSPLCPEWSRYSIDSEDSSKSNCEICKQLFPLVQISEDPNQPPKCPCSIYTPEFLLIRLSEIINYNWRKQNETNNRTKPSRS